MKYGKILFTAAALAMVNFVHAYTPAETNELVRGMLLRVRSFYNHDNFRDGEIVVPWQGDIPDTWEGFLGKANDGRWTTEERKCAFDWYLSTLGTTDFSVLPKNDQRLVRTALGRCNVFNYTNSVPHLRALALNPKGVYRKEAIDLFLKFSPVSDTTTSFIETIMTNVVGFSSVERGIACATYAEQLRLFSPTGVVDAAAKGRAVQMFYRNRNLGYDSAYLIDALFVSHIEGYAMSSNRLELALCMLTKMESDDFDRKDIIAITNQLLSSTQPLRQLNIGVGGDE